MSSSISSSEVLFQNRPGREGALREGEAPAEPGCLARQEPRPPEIVAFARALFPLGLALMLAAGIIVAVEAGFRTAGGLSKVEPGMTAIEFVNKLKDVESGNKVLVVGDSRVGWGFSETDCETGMRAAGLEAYAALNAGRAACSSSDTLRWLLDKPHRAHAGVLAINYSPGGFYQFAPRPLSTNLPSRQVVQDDRIDQYLRQRLATHGKDCKIVFPSLWNAAHGRPLPLDTCFVEREQFCGGFYNAKIATNDGQPFDQAGHQLDYYTLIIDMIAKDPATATKRQEWINLLREATGQGWKVVVVRIPVGHRMAYVEAKLPSSLQPQALASDAGVPFIDYQEDSRLGEVSTLDESHLAPESTRRVSHLLGGDVARLVALTSRAR
jgi:hypothetical protein